MNITKMPKVELHLHLDCSLSYQVVKKLNPTVTLAEYRDTFIANATCHSLQDYLSRAVKGFELMQDKESLRLVTLDLFEQLKADGVIYAEIRFAPHLHLEAGLTPEQVVDIVDSAMLKGMRETGVDASLILCTLRHFSADQSMETVKLVEAFGHKTISGFDIAADEAGYPIDNHIAAFHYARDRKLHVTAHAGEACGAESVWETLDNFFPARIGHGIRSMEDPRLIEHLKQKKIHLEVCPTSNIQTGVYARYGDHQVDQIFKSGISMSISTDGRTISDVTLEQEYQKLMDHFHWNQDYFLKCNLNAIDVAFIDQNRKDQLKERFLKHWQSD